MVTIKMIAARCGVSSATVSKALNGAPDIGASTAERIRAVASEMGYIPSAAARALKTSRSNNFGILFEEHTDSGLTHEFFALILNGFKRRAEALGYDITFISNHLGGRNLGCVEHARFRNCDGIMVAAVNGSYQVVGDLIDSGIPVVTIDGLTDNCGSILSDNLGGMRELVTYIYGMGHRRIAYIHGEDTAVTRYRVASFYRTCKELGVVIPKEYVVAAQFHDPAYSEAVTRELLALPEPPTCIIYPDDFSYLGGLNEFERQGLSVPADISAAGYDGINLSQVLRPKLTTLKQDADLMGVKAAEELVRAVEEGQSYIPRRITIPGTLLVGGTVRNINP